MRRSLSIAVLTTLIAVSFLLGTVSSVKVRAQQVIYAVGCSVLQTPLTILDSVVPASLQHNANACFDTVGNLTLQPAALNQQAANGALGGSIALVGGTKTVVFPNGFKYISTPICLAQDTTTIANTVTCVPNGPPATQVVLTGTGTDTVKWELLGNPN